MSLASPPAEQRVANALSSHCGVVQSLPSFAEAEAVWDVLRL